MIFNGGTKYGIIVDVIIVYQILKMYNQKKETWF